MTTYRHTQTSRFVLVFGGTAFLLLIGTLLRAGARPLAIAVVVTFFLWVSQFFALTVTVGHDEIRIAFGLGLIRKTISTPDVGEARRVRNHWYYGWGIRKYPGGWLFSVAGLDAVELVLRNGKVYRIGSDEPDRLLAAIEAVSATSS